LLARALRRRVKVKPDSIGTAESAAGFAAVKIKKLQASGYKLKKSSISGPRELE